MDAGTDAVKTAGVLGVLLAGFFIAGFAFHSVAAPSTRQGR